MTAPQTKELKEFSEGFQEWWDHTHRAANRALRSIPQDILEDVLQDLVLEVLERRKRGHGLPTVAFAVQFARWRSLDRLRKNRLRKKTETSLESARVQLEAPKQESVVALREVEALVEHLPLAQKEVIRFWISGYEAQEIARLTGKKETTIRSLLRHARYRVATVLGEREWL